MPAAGEVNLQQACARCGCRRGLHRYGDEVCPNTYWRPGNGRPQWLDAWKFQPKASGLVDFLRRQRERGIGPAA